MTGSNPYGYYTRLLFDKSDSLAAAVLHDDYTAYYDLDKGRVGSNLADGNLATTREEFLRFLPQYLKDMEDYYKTVETNDFWACNKLLRKLDVLDVFIVIHEAHEEFTIEEVKRLAKYWNKEWRYMND